MEIQLRGGLFLLLSPALHNNILTKLFGVFSSLDSGRKNNSCCCFQIGSHIPFIVLYVVIARVKTPGRSWVKYPVAAFIKDGWCSSIRSAKEDWNTTLLLVFAVTGNRYLSIEWPQSPFTIQAINYRNGTNVLSKIIISDLVSWFLIGQAIAQRLVWKLN